MPYIKKSTGRVLSLLEERAYNKSSQLREITWKAMSIQDIRKSGKPYYVFIGELNACDKCKDLHGIAFPASRAVTGANFPPLHPNCKCDVKPYHHEDALLLGLPNANDNPSGIAADDWRFFGWNGDAFDPNPDKIYTDTYFGKAIDEGDFNHSDLDMHLVDRIARILFHETSDKTGQEAIAWMMLNRMLKEGAQYTTNWNDPLTLFNIITAREQFEVFQSQHNANPTQPNSYAPLDWIAGLEGTAMYNEQQSSWENSLRLAKLLVSAACNPLMDNPDVIREVFGAWVPTPFDCETPYDIWEYRTESRVSGQKEWEQTIGGNTFFI